MVASYEFDRQVSRPITMMTNLVGTLSYHIRIFSISASRFLQVCLSKCLLHSRYCMFKVSNRKNNFITHNLVIWQWIVSSAVNWSATWPWAKDTELASSIFYFHVWVTFRVDGPLSSPSFCSLGSWCFFPTNFKIKIMAIGQFKKQKVKWVQQPVGTCNTSKAIY